MPLETRVSQDKSGAQIPSSPAIKGLAPRGSVSSSWTISSVKLLDNIQREAMPVFHARS